MHNAVSAYLLTFWQQIQPVDFWLIKHINQDWSNGIFDAVLPLFRETLFWVPLYFFLLLYALLNFKTKGYWWILGGVLTAAISDLLSSHLIKENIFRLRPCQNPEVAPYLRFFINYCPQSSSFTSSHATTYFAQAVFFLPHPQTGSAQELDFFHLGRPDFLYAGICGRALSFRCFVRCTIGMYDRLVHQQALSAANRNACCILEE